MKKTGRKLIHTFLTALMCLAMIAPTVAKADAVTVKPYLAFGADLTAEQKKTVMNLLNVADKDLPDYEVIEVTNADEHKNLDEYLDKSIIGTRALSSVKIEEADARTGISVTIKNISFCTEEMYTNALATAGVTDARVVVAAPFEISGTAALVGAMKAYGGMIGEEVSEANADAANHELVLTGELGESLGADKAAQLVALLKQKVADGNLSSQEDILNAIDESAKELGVPLTTEQREKLNSLMTKISALDLDTNKLKDQAKGIYDKLKEVNVDIGDAKGFFGKIGDFFKKIANFFIRLFD